MLRENCWGGEGERRHAGSEKKISHVSFHYTCYFYSYDGFNIGYDGIWDIFCLQREKKKVKKEKKECSYFPGFSVSLFFFKEYSSVLILNQRTHFFCLKKYTELEMGDSKWKKEGALYTFENFVSQVKLKTRIKGREIISHSQFLFEVEI